MLKIDSSSCTLDLVTWYVQRWLCRLRIPPTVRCYSFSAGRWDLKLFCRRGKLSCGIVLLHDNALLHSAWQTQALLHDQFHWDIFKYPPYSPDLAPSDFFLSPKMKEYLIGKHFANDEDLNDAGWITRRSHGMKRVYTNWCQGRTSMLMSEATYVPKHVYSISVLLLLKNTLVWGNVFTLWTALVIKH